MLKAGKMSVFYPPFAQKIFFVCFCLWKCSYLLGKEIIKLFLTNSWIKIITCKPHLFRVFIGPILLHLMHWGIKMM